MGLFGCDYLETRGSIFPDYICKLTMQQVDSNTARDVCLSSRYSECYNRKNASMCFITTAVCLTMGKSDECEELTVMRKFRDGWLKMQSDGPSLIEEYYHTAPAIVRKIDQQPNRNAIYAEIYQKYILPCVEKAKAQKFSDARKIYVEMFSTLKAQYT